MNCINDKTIVTHRYPEDGQYKGGLIKGVYYLQTDLDALKQRAKEHFYEEATQEEMLNDERIKQVPHNLME